MKICFPAETLQGMNSVVYGHFGSAPGFVIVDTQDMSAEEIQKRRPAPCSRHVPTLESLGRKGG